MKALKNLILLFFVFFLHVGYAQVAETPPMGWNSYNSFGSAVTESEVKANADYMATNLKEYGWQYIVVDFLWSYNNPRGSRIGNIYQKRLQDGSFIPFLAMDEWGRLLPEVNKFPSAVSGKGFKPLGDYVHSLGLKFGIHLMRGIPRQAVWLKTPVRGTDGITADMIADTTSTCQWLNHMYGLNMDKPGTQEYLNSLLDLYKQWGVDFIKVDDISRPYHTKEIEGYAKAIKNSGGTIVLSLSPGETPRDQASHVTTFANMWRMVDDFWDDWEAMLNMFDYAKKWQGTGGEGHWPDCDMLQIGKISKKGPVGPERYSRFTDDELYTHMTFWSIYRSPLMIGGNLPENREIEHQLFANDEVLAVNQHAEKPRQVYKTEDKMVWASKEQGSKALYIALFNLGEKHQKVSVDFADIGLKDKVKVRDLWEKMDLGVFKKQYGRLLKPHASSLLKLEMD